MAWKEQKSEHNHLLSDKCQAECKHFEQHGFTRTSPHCFRVGTNLKTHPYVMTQIRSAYPIRVFAIFLYVFSTVLDRISDVLYMFILKLRIIHGWNILIITVKRQPNYLIWARDPFIFGSLVYSYNHNTIIPILWVVHNY